MWLEQQTVSSLESCPLFSVLYREIPLYSPGVPSSVTALQDLQQEVEQHDDNEGEEEMETQ